MQWPNPLKRKVTFRQKERKMKHHEARSAPLAEKKGGEGLEVQSGFFLVSPPMPLFPQREWCAHTNVVSAAACTVICWLSAHDPVVVALHFFLALMKEQSDRSIGPVDWAQKRKRWKAKLQCYVGEKMGVPSTAEVRSGRGGGVHSTCVCVCWMGVL